MAAMNISQLSITYLPVEDRLQLRINTAEHDELRVWLTRRFVGGILPVLERCTEDHAARALQKTTGSFAQNDAHVRKSLAEFAGAQHLDKADFVTPFVEEPRSVLLGGATFLPSEAQITPHHNGLTAMVLKSDLAELKFELNEQMLHALLRLIVEGLGHAGWSDVRGTALPEPVELARRMLN
jgi:hypothetical protein